MGDLIQLPNIEKIDGVPMVSSREVAERFEKRHADVIRSIEALECSADFNGRNFASVEYTDAKGEKRPQYLMTRDGFSFLCMGFTGKRAAQWKERFIEAFNAMEEQLSRGIIRTDQLDLAINTALDAVKRLTDLSLENKQDIQDTKKKVTNLDKRFSVIEGRVVNIEESLKKKISTSTRKAHIQTLLKIGNRCPLCNESVSGKKIEIDHYHGPKWPELHHTWPLCADCHSTLSHNRSRTGYVQTAFENYHRLREQLAKDHSQIQMTLFPRGTQ